MIDAQLKSFHDSYVVLINTGELKDTDKPEIDNSVVQPTSCAWTFTIHNPVEDNIKTLCELANKREKSTKKGSAIMWELEVGWGQGVKGNPLHIQGYIEVAAKHSLEAVKKLFKCKHAHLEKARGSYESNEFYTSKDFNNPQLSHLYTEDWMRVKVGLRHDPISRDSTGQGKRNDIEALKKDIMDGKLSQKELVDAHTDLFLRFPAGVAKMMILQKVEKPRMKVYWHWGVPGSGKTYKAKLYTSPETTYIKPAMSGIWYQGYEPTIHKTVVLDEVDKTEKAFSLSNLLNLMDESLITVQCKGGSQWFVPEVLVLTSTKSPAELYEGDIDYEQIIRRCDNIIEFTVKQTQYCKKTKFQVYNGKTVVDVENPRK